MTDYIKGESKLVRGDKGQKVRGKLLDAVSARHTSLTSGLCTAQDCQVCVAAFLSFVGYNCEPYNNPADFFLDVINGDSSAVVLSRADRDEGGEPVG